MTIWSIWPNFSIDPRTKRGLLDLNLWNITQNNALHHKTASHIWQNCQYHQLSLTETKSGESYLIREEYPVVGPACLRRQSPRVAFRNNDIYVIEDEDYEEPRERQPKVRYKLKLADNPAAQNMPHEEDYSDNNYESIDENAV